MEDVKEPLLPPSYVDEKPAPPSLPLPASTSTQPASRSCRSRLRKFILFFAGAFFGFHFLIAAGRGLHKFFDRDFARGWGIIRDGSPFDRNGHAFDEMDGFSLIDNKDYLFLPTIDLASLSDDSTLPIPASFRDIVVHLEDAVEAELVLSTTDASEASIRVVSEDATAPAVSVLHSTDIAGIRIAAASSPLTIHVAVPVGRPISFSAHGSQLSIPAVDLQGVDFKTFVVSSSAASEVAITNLHARSGHIQLGAGAISGSFNVSKSLILKTAIGAINANVSIFEHHCHGNKTHTPSLALEHLSHDEQPSKLERKHKHEKQHRHEDEEEKKHHKHGKKGKKHDKHHGPPKGVVFVLAETGIGAVDIAYVDSGISNKTSLISKALSKIGSINVSVLPGFKGLFAEGARIGEVSYDSLSSNVTIFKEVHHGPGGFIKGFVGPAPPHRNSTHPCHKHKKDKKHPRHESEDVVEGFFSESDDHSAPPSPHHPGKPDGEHPPPPPPPGSPPPPPPGKGPHPHPPPGGPHGHKHPHHRPHHRGPPPPGYGAVFAFASTGKVSVLFR